MKSLGTILGVFVLAVGSLSAPACAGLYGERFGDIYLTYDVRVSPWHNPSSNCNEDLTHPVPPFVAFEWFLVIAIDFADIGIGNQNGSNGIQAWEAWVHIPDEISVLTSTLRPGGSMNVGHIPADNDSNWIVGTGVLVPAASTPFAVVEYRGMLLAPAVDLELSITAAEPSSFTAPGGPGPIPGWAEFQATGDCDQACLRGFRRWNDCHNFLRVNFTGCCECRCICDPVATTSWGAIKARF